MIAESTILHAAHSRLIAACRGCGAVAQLREILRMEPMPLVGAFAASKDQAEAAPRYPLTLAQCTACGLVQVLEDISDQLLFRQYSYASSSVAGVVHHFASFASLLARRYGPNRVRLLEIGCNDGVLLKQLPDTWTKVGVDPSDVALAGRTPSYELINEPFDAVVASSLPGAGLFDVVTASNCLAHVSDIQGLVEGAAVVLREGGEFWVEVHDLGAALRSGQWDVIYHEHKAEWSVDTLVRCISPRGFEFLNASIIAHNGGTLRALFRRARGLVRQHRHEKLHPHNFHRLLLAYERRRESEVYRALQTYLGRGADLCAYGASGRGNVWLNQLPELPFRYVVDDSPLRAGRWIPGVGVPVVSADWFARHPADLCVVTAWNYADAIRSRHRWFRGGWLTAFHAELDPIATI
jgi:SAM-dependent methyltransferase